MVSELYQVIRAIMTLESPLSVISLAKLQGFLKSLI
jgi:hypothetical protein